MIYNLPESVIIDGKEFAIRSDFRAILDIIEVLNGPELDAEERVFFALLIFYPDVYEIPLDNLPEALRKCFWFINGGEEETDNVRKSPRLMDWEKDFPLIIAPVNRVVGHEIRSDAHFHWWSFLSAYMEIGECTFAQVVHIRDKRAKGKALDKFDKDWYRQNHELVDLKAKTTSAEDEIFRKWGGGSVE